MLKTKLPSLVQKYILAKGISEDQYYQLIKKEELPDFSFFADIEKAVSRIKKAISNSEKILIYGDYDADGIGASAIMLLALHKLNAKSFNFYIPDRENDGYGLNKEKVHHFHQENYSLIITVDNGISANEAIDFANSLAIDTIICDHHQLLDQLPSAYAIIHPQLSNYTTTPMSGGFTAFALATKLIGYEDEYLKALATLTTISDVMPLVKENRSLVIDGLAILNKNLYSQFILLNNNSPYFTSSSLSSPVASALNALARVGDCDGIRNAVYLLITSSKEKQQHFYQKISAAITLRKKLMADALSEIPPSFTDNIIVYHNTNLKEGIIGLLATSLSKLYNRPAFVLTGGDNLKGSVRSAGDFAVDVFFKDNKDLFIAYGGHKEAGGFTIASANLPDLKAALQSLHINYEYNYQAIEINIDDIDDEAIAALELLGPFGAGNPEPEFMLKISKSLLQPRGNHLFGKIGRYRLVGFNLIKDYANAAEDVSIVFSVVKSYFRDTLSLELRIKKIL